MRTIHEFIFLGFITLLAIDAHEVRAGTIEPAVAKPASRTPLSIDTTLSGKLGYYFAASAADLNARPASIETSADDPGIVMGEVYDTADILALMDKGAQPSSPTSLFSNTTLYISLFDSADQLAASPLIAKCGQLDIYADITPLRQQMANCDGDVYSVSVSRLGVSLLRNGELDRLYKLDPGNYSLNGVPFRVD